MVLKAMLKGSLRGGIALACLPAILVAWLAMAGGDDRMAHWWGRKLGLH